MRCWDCKFWKTTDSRGDSDEEFHEDNQGECRRHAPLPVVYPERDAIQEDCRWINYAVWPRVECTDWCGEFSPNARKVMEDINAMPPEDKKQFKQLIGLT